MDLLCSVNWIALLVLAITLLLFKVLNQLAMKINWTFVVLISMVMGAVIGLVFASDNNSYLVWVDLIGDIYINVITALVAPVILISIRIFWIWKLHIAVTVDQDQAMMPVKHLRCAKKM